MTPFLSIVTPTYKRPHALATCIESVRMQTAADDVEQIVIVDHLGVGIGGMYASLDRYVSAIHGRYVAVLSDDDVLFESTVVERLRAFADSFVERGHVLPVIIVRVLKMGLDIPIGPPWPPVEGLIDLSCLIVRGDIWRAHAKDYGHRYEGDFDFADALAKAGHDAEFCNLVFARGEPNAGRAES